MATTGNVSPPPTPTAHGGPENVGPDSSLSSLITHLLGFQNFKMPRAEPETLTKLQRAMFLSESSEPELVIPRLRPLYVMRPLILEYYTIIKFLRGNRIISVASEEQLQFLSDKVAGGKELKVSIHGSATEDKDALIEFAGQLGFRVMH